MVKLATLREYAMHKDGTYVAASLDNESKTKLDTFVRDNLKLTERVKADSYHITIIYSRTPVPSAEKVKGMIPDGTATIVGYEIFPTKNDGKCLVARLSFPFANDLNARLTKEGATSDYSEYKPHMTLAYDTEQDIDISKLPIPTFPLSFMPVTVEPLDPEFVPSNA